MRNFKLLEFYKVAVFLTVLVTFSSSCKKDDKVNADYVGTWIAVNPISTEFGSTSLKEIMTLTETTFTDLMQILIPGNNWVEYVNMKGSISVNGNLIDVTIAEVGTAFDMNTGLPTGVIKTYKTGSPEFDTLLSKAGRSKTFKLEYSVSGKELTLKSDNNGDGDYLDANETKVYTKQ